MALDRANFEQAQRDLQALGIEFRLRNHRVCDSLYLNDPEGHEIELTTYEV
jgi:catechol-2,3-dioxygenase